MLSVIHPATLKKDFMLSICTNIIADHLKIHHVYLKTKQYCSSNNN